MGESVMTKTEKEIALEVIDGKWGNGDERIVNLTNAGYNASSVQRLVNQILKENIVTEEPVKEEKPKEITEITIDLKKCGALIINFTE